MVLSLKISHWKTYDFKGEGHKRLDCDIGVTVSYAFFVVAAVQSPRWDSPWDSWYSGHIFNIM